MAPLGVPGVLLHVSSGRMYRDKHGSALSTVRNGAEADASEAGDKRTRLLSRTVQRSTPIVTSEPGPLRPSIALPGRPVLGLS